MFDVHNACDIHVCICICSGLLLLSFACLLNVPVTCLWVSGTDLVRQLYVLPHWDWNCRSNLLSHPQYTDIGPTSPSCKSRAPGDWQGDHWSAKFWVTDMTRECQVLGHRHDSGVPSFGSPTWLDPERAPWEKRESNPGLPFSRWTPCLLASETVCSEQLCMCYTCAIGIKSPSS